MTDSTQPAKDCRQSNVGYIWLAYSVFFFIEPLLRHQALFWAKSVAIYAVFVAIYVTYVRTFSTTVRLFCLAGFTVLGLAAYPVNTGSSGFLVFTAAFAPFLIPRTRDMVIVMAGLILLILTEGLLYNPRNLNYATTIFFVLVVGTSNLFLSQQKRADSRLRMAHEEIEKLAALAERERIARDLHDVLGHTLSVIVLKAELARRLLERDPTLPAPQRALDEIADVESTARTALAEVREAIGGYRSKGLAAELELARRTLDAAGVALSLDARTAPLSTALVSAALGPSEETVLALAIREAVTNIVRHAEATRCTIRIASTPSGTCTLSVHDNGPHAVLHEGNGLSGMRERVHSLGGRFSLESQSSAEGPGTTLRVELPASLATSPASQPLAEPSDGESSPVLSARAR